MEKKEDRKKILLAAPGGALDAVASALGHRDDLEVHTALTAEDAFMFHRANRMDFIIADLNLPEMTGDVLCKRIREDEALRRVYVSLICEGRKGELKRCGLCGANNYIKAPLETDRIVEIVERVLELTGRRPERILVKISVNGIYNNESFFCICRNISTSGMLIESEKSLARGDSITCKFFLPDADQIEVEGKVVRVSWADLENTHSYGVEFTYMTQMAQRTIRAYIEGIIGAESPVP